MVSLNADFRLPLYIKGWHRTAISLDGVQGIHLEPQSFHKTSCRRPPEELCTRKGTEKTALSSKRCQVSKSYKLPRVRLKLTTLRL